MKLARRIKRPKGGGKPAGVYGGKPAGERRLRPDGGGRTRRCQLRTCAALWIALMPAVTLAQSPEPGADKTTPRIVLDGLAGRAGDAFTGPVTAGTPAGDAGVAAGIPVGADVSTAAGAPVAAGVPVGVDISTAAGAPVGPLDDLRRRWQEAVHSGRTDLGFRAWVLGALENPQATSDNDEKPAVFGSQAERTRDVSARWAERAGPVVLGEAGRVVTTFGASIPTAFCAPLIVCTIELEPGEVLTDTPSIGDSARWQMVVKVQGVEPETRVLEIKPSDDAGMTNLVIPTDRRLYTITLVNDTSVHTPILSFRYPDTQAKQVRQRIDERKAKEAAARRQAAAIKAAAAKERKAVLQKDGIETTAGLRDPATLDFRFRVSGSAPFKPVRVYTDGKQTYIDLHPSYSGPLPTLVPARGEENKVLNTRVARGGTQLIADRVIRDMWLQAGKRRVRIRRAGR